MGSRHAHCGGFTTLELLAVIAISGLLVALAVPSLAELRRSAGLSSSANEMLWALYYARSTALLRNLPTVVCLTADGETCLTARGAMGSGWLIFHDANRSGPPQLSGDDQLLHTTKLAEGFKVSGTRDAVTYWPSTLSGTTGTFTLCPTHGGSQGRAVVVSQTGRPRVAGAVSCAP